MRALLPSASTAAFTGLLACTGLLAFPALTLTVGCSEPEGRSGTNTNWLRACDVDGDCLGENVCVCSSCTTVCEVDADCDDGQVCAPGVAARTQCAGPASRSCRRPCETAAECPAGELCHFGTCTAPLPAAACPADALVCEDFEAPPAYAEVISDGNTATTVDGAAISGTSSLRSTVASGPSVAHLVADIPPQSSGVLYLRAWVRVPDQLPHNVAPLALVSKVERDFSLRLVVRDATLELWSYTTPMEPRAELVAGQWHCLEAEVTVGDAPDGRVVVSVNEEQIGVATGVDTLPEGGFEGLEVGSVWSAAASTIEVDRVLLGPTRVGCWELL